MLAASCSSEDARGSDDLPSRWVCVSAANECICTEAEQAQEELRLCAAVGPDSSFPCCYVEKTVDGTALCTCEADEEFNPGTCPTRAGKVDTCPPVEGYIPDPPLAWRCAEDTTRIRPPCICDPIAGPGTGSCSLECCAMQRSNRDDDYECACWPPELDGSCAFAPIRDEPVPSCPPPEPPRRQPKTIAGWECIIHAGACQCSTVPPGQSAHAAPCPIAPCCRLADLAGGAQQCLCTAEEPCAFADAVPECPPR
jgi:hypothetical protein